MNPQLNQYINETQYNKICKYWNIINNLTYKLENFNYSKYKYYELSEDEETIKDCNLHNKRINKMYKLLIEKINYYENEYIAYINKIGFKFNDSEQNECLFNLLNNGVILA